MLDAGGVVAGPWRPRARKAVSASGPQHEVEHQAWPVTIEGPGEGFSIGVAVAGEGEGMAARRGGAFEARRAAPGADDAAAPSSLAFCAARKPDIPVTARTSTVPSLPASAWRAVSGSQDAIPGLTPAATASGCAWPGSGNRMASGEAMR